MKKCVIDTEAVIAAVFLQVLLILTHLPRGVKLIQTSGPGVVISNHSGIKVAKYCFQRVPVRNTERSSENLNSGFGR